MVEIVRRCTLIGPEQKISYNLCRMLRISLFIEIELMCAKWWTFTYKLKWPRTLDTSEKMIAITILPSNMQIHITKYILLLL